MLIPDRLCNRALRSGSPYMQGRNLKSLTSSAQHSEHSCSIICRWEHMQPLPSATAWSGRGKVLAIVGAML